MRAAGEKSNSKRIPRYHNEGPEKGNLLKSYRETAGRNKTKETVGQNEIGKQQRATGREKIGNAENVLSSELDSKI